MAGYVATKAQKNPLRPIATAVDAWKNPATTSRKRRAVDGSTGAKRNELSKVIVLAARHHAKVGCLYTITATRSKP